MAQELNRFMKSLVAREAFRDQYSHQRDPIRDDRLLWRAQSLRHMVHLLPGQTILELGAGSNLFTGQLHTVTRGENRITAVSFHPSHSPRCTSSIEYLHVDSLPGPLDGRTFDLVVAIDLMDERNCAPLLQLIFQLLAPGGQVIFYESNPWNPVLRLRRLLSRLLGTTDRRRLLSRPQLYELVSEVGFIKILTVFNDFVYAPLNPPLAWLLRNVSILFENLPIVQTLAGSILIYGQRPGPRSFRVSSLSQHECLRRAVSVVIPCYNEEMNLRPLVSRIVGLYEDYLHEIILVDDNSTDDTADVIRSIAKEYALVKSVYRKPPNGVGLALADGYRAASGKYVLSMDCDFTHLLPEIRDIFDAAVKGYDVVLGSRFSRHSVLLNYPFQKILANRGFHVLAQIAFRRRFRDLTNNLKLMKREVVESLRLSEPHFAVNAETGLQPLLMGFSLCEVPISWINRTPDMGASSFRLAKVGAGYWRVLLRLTVETLFGFRPLKRRSPSTIRVGEQTQVAEHLQ
jgi:dolichol-phosphate mannosyltransferase